MIYGTIQESPNLDHQLAQIEPRLGRNILRTAVRAGGNIVRDAARQNVNSRSGKLRRDIRTQIRRGRAGETVASVGVFSRGKKTDAFYAPFVEKGHRIGIRRRRDLRYRRRVTQLVGGQVKPYPFLLPALIAKQADVQRVVMEHIRSRLDELV